MFRIFAAAFMASLFLPFLPCVAGQGKLGKVRDATHDEYEEQEHESETDHRHSCSCDESSFLGQLLLGIFIDDSNDAQVVLVESPASSPSPPYCHYLFPDHPYPNSEPGYLRRDPRCAEHGADLPAENMSLLPFAIRLTVENGNDFNNLNRFNGSLFLDTSIGIGLSTNWHYFAERLPLGFYDDFVFGSVNAFYRWLESPYVTSRLGAGVLFVADDFFFDVGAQVHLGLDVFPIRPLVISGELDIGGVGDASYLHTRVTTGLAWHSFEIYAGYDAMWFDSVRLDGPLIGMRIWF